MEKLGSGTNKTTVFDVYVCVTISPGKVGERLTGWDGIDRDRKEHACGGPLMARMNMGRLRLIL